MGYQVRIDLSAEIELTEAVAYYEAQQSGLGISFLLQFYDTVSYLKENPTLYPQVYKVFRRALMKKFRYGIYYVLDEDRSQVIVLSIWHTSQNPNKLKDRLK